MSERRQSNTQNVPEGEAKEIVRTALEHFMKGFSFPYSNIRDQINDEKNEYIPLVYGLLCIQSFFRDSFTHIPRVLINSAVEGSGKSFTGQMFCQFANNGTMKADPSYASITAEMRDCDSEITIWFDEAQHVLEPRDTQFYLILKKGYESFDTKREHFDLETKKRVTTDLKCMVGLSYNIRDHRNLDPAIRRRCIAIQIRPYMGELEEFDYSEVPKIHKNLRKLGGGYFTDFEVPKDIGLGGGDKDKFMGSIIIADWLGGEIGEQVRKASKVWTLSEKKPDKRDRARLCAQACKAVIETLGKGKGCRDCLFNGVRDWLDCEDEESMDDHETKWFLKDFGVKTDKQSFRCPHCEYPKTKRGYYWSSFDRLFEDHFPESSNKEQGTEPVKIVNNVFDSGGSPKPIGEILPEVDHEKWIKVSRENMKRNK